MAVRQTGKRGWKSDRFLVCLEGLLPKPTALIGANRSHITPATYIYIFSTGLLPKPTALVGDNRSHRRPGPTARRAESLETLADSPESMATLARASARSFNARAMCSNSRLSKAPAKSFARLYRGRIFELDTCRGVGEGGGDGGGGKGVLTCCLP